MSKPRTAKAGKVHVRKNDLVLVTTGKDAGKRGKVIKVDPDKSRIIVEGIGITKRHTKPTRSLPQGGIIEKEGTIASSNAMLVCTKCQQPTRIAKKLVEGKQARACKRCGELIDN